jgi:4-hydroxybutyrate CoA-transferase
VPRTLADTVVTEYGVAHLFGKTARERADELIRVAAPEFREELTAASRRLFYP